MIRLPKKCAGPPRAGVQAVTPGGARVARSRGWVLLLGALVMLIAPVRTSHAQSAQLLQAPNIYNGDPNMVPLGVATGDFNGDGYLDFVVAERSLNSSVSDQIVFYTGNSDGSFTESSITSVHGTIAGQLYATNHIIGVGSFNGPGEPLGVAVALTTSTLCGSGGPGVFMYYGQPGNSSISLCVPTATAPTSIAVADFNNDGFDDWAISNPNGAAAGTMTVYLNIAQPGAGESGFYFYANYSATSLNVSGTLYGTIVAGNLGPQESGPSLALLASTGPFSQYVDVFENFEASTKGVTTLTFSIPADAVSTNNSLSDIAIGDVNGSGTAAVIGIGTGTLSYIPVTDTSDSQALPLLGALTKLPTGAAGYALALGTFDENVYSDVAFLSLNHNFGVNLDPSFTDSPLITPFGAVGQNIATGLSTALNKWIIVDAGIYQQENPVSFVEIPEARSIAVYLVDPTTGFPAQPSIYAPTTTSLGILPAFAVGDFNGDGLPDVAVLGLDQANFAATVAPFLNVSQPTGLPLFQAQPIFDLGTGTTTGAALTPFSIVAGSFRAIDPDIAVLINSGVTLLENQGANTNGELTFVQDPTCIGTFTADDNCYLAGDPNFPGLFSSQATHAPMIAADVTGKGYADVIVAIPENCNASAGKPRSAIYVLLSNGDGTFQKPIYVQSPVADPVGLAYGKLMGTAYNDLVVVNGGEQCSTATFPTNPGAALLPNKDDGSGTFAGPLALFLTTATSPFPFVSGVAVADMNGDGTPDVVISANDGIHVLLNSKANPGAFTDHGAVPLYSASDNVINASRIDIADVNLDTFPDVVATIGGNVYVFLGDGVGGLASPAQGFSSGPNSYQLRAIDVNGDGSPDVLVSNSTGFSAVLNAMAAPTGSPLAQFNDLSLDFNGIAAGVPETLQLNLANTGTAPLLITNIAFANSTANEFTYQVVSCTGASYGILPMSMPAGSTCTFNVVFTPGTIGPVNAQMLFYDNAAVSSAPDAPATTGASPYVQTIALTGAGIAAQANTSIVVTNSPSIVAVGTVVQYTVKLSNAGTSPATNVTFSHQLESSVSIGTYPANCTLLHSISSTALSCAVGTLAVGSPYTFSFTVTPTAATTLTNPFVFTQDQSDSNPQSTTDNINVLSTLSVTIPTINESITVSDSPSFSDIADSENIKVTDQVTVTPLVNHFAPPAASFSTANLGFNSNTAVTQALTLSNVGGAPIVFAAPISISAGFAITQIFCSSGGASLPASLSSGGACVFTISYAGTASSGTITFTDNAALSSPPSMESGPNYSQTIFLSGTGAGSGTLAPPSGTVTIPMINEPITVTDAPSFSNIFVSEQIMVVDTASVSVSSPCEALVSSGVTVTRGGFVYSPITRQYTQTVTLTDATGAAIQGPLSLLIVGLSSNAKLLNPSGVTTCAAPLGTPYVTDSIVSLAPAGSTSLVLKFSNSNTSTAITYSTAVEAGSGAP